MGSCQTHSDKYNFLKPIIFAWKFTLHLWQQILLAVSHCSFLRKYLLNTQVRRAIVGQILHKGKMIFHEKKYKTANLAHKSNCVPRVFPMFVHVYWSDLIWSDCTLVSNRSAWCKQSISSVRITKWHVLKRWDLI